MTILFSHCILDEFWER